MTWGFIALGAIVFSDQANAALVVNIGGTISGGAVVGGTTFTDNEAGVDANPSVGVLDIGAYLNTVAFPLGINALTMSSGNPIASLSIDADGYVKPGTVLPTNISILITDTDYTVPIAPLTLAQTTTMLSSVAGVTANGKAVGYFGDSNSPFDVDGADTGEATSQLNKGIALNAPSKSGPITGTPPYSLTMFITLDILSLGSDPIDNLQVSGNLSASPLVTQPEIPEPASALTFGIGLLLTSAAMLRTRFLR
jgi:hypothetical protein